MATGDNQVGDIAECDGAEPVRVNENFSGRKGESTNRGVCGKSSVDGFLRGLQHVFRRSNCPGIERELYAGLGERGGGRGRAVSGTQWVKRRNFGGVGVFFRLGPF